MNRTTPITFIVFLYPSELKKPLTFPDIKASSAFELTRSM